MVFYNKSFKIYLMNNLKRVISLLQEDNGYNRYTLDGQVSLLDDYLAWCPEDKEVIRS